MIKRYNGNDPKINRDFPFHRGIVLPSLFKTQYTELKLSCETTLFSKILFIVTVTLIFDLMTAK